MDAEFTEFLTSQGLSLSFTNIVDEVPPQAVDETLLRSFLNRDLTEHDAEWVAFLVSRYGDWNQAYFRLQKELAVQTFDAIDSDDLQASKGEVGWFRPGSRRRIAAAIASMVLVAVVAIGLYWSSRPSLIAELQDGQNTVALKSDGEVTGIPSLDEQLRSLVIAALKGEKVVSLASLPLAPGTKGTLFPPMSKSLLIQPYHTIVSDDRPVFRWMEINKAKSYTVRVYDSDGQQIPLGQEPLTTTEWKPSLPLIRGVVMTWDVFVDAEEGTAVLPQDETRPAFRILSEEDYQKYQAATTQLAGSNLALGTYLLSVGLLDEAQNVFEQLQTDNPESEVVRNLLKNLRSLRNN